MGQAAKSERWSTNSDECKAHLNALPSDTAVATILPHLFLGASLCHAVVMALCPPMLQAYLLRKDICSCVTTAQLATQEADAILLPEGSIRIHVHRPPPQRPPGQDQVQDLCGLPSPLLFMEGQWFLMPWGPESPEIPMEAVILLVRKKCPNL